MHYISPYKNTILGACIGHLHLTTAHTSMYSVLFFLVGACHVSQCVSLPGGSANGCLRVFPVVYILLPNVYISCFTFKPLLLAAPLLSLFELGSWRVVGSPRGSQC